MGGTRAREEKKKNNHVYSSGGGGGGTKGPAKIDKRKLTSEQRALLLPTRQTDKDGTSGNDKQSSSEKVMDVGSKGGGWTRKSPRLMLLEWTQASKRPKPRYKTLSEPSGKFRCKVVLPDPKDNKNDLVTFLDGEHAADTEDEAHQRGALAALHAVAGHRALHRVLPSAFIDLWTALGQRAQQKEEQAARREERDKTEKEKAQARKAAEARRKPLQVVMSGDKRQAVEAALRGSNAQVESTGTVTSSVAVSEAEASNRLQALGFSDSQALLAISNVSHNGMLEVGKALDWLLLNLPAHLLPAAFADDISSNPVQVVRHVRNATDCASNSVSNEARKLTAYGYSIEDAGLALAACEGDFEGALSLLYSKLTGEQNSGVVTGVKSEDWQEEVEALQAIHESNFTQIRPAMMEMKLDDGRSFLDLRMPASYPERPPILGLRSPTLGGPAALEITRKLSEMSTCLLGSPMVHDLFIACQDFLADSQTRHSHPSNQILMTEEPQARQTDSLSTQNVPQEIGKTSENSSQCGKERHRQRRPFELSRSDIETQSARLLENSKRPSEKLARMQAIRRELPASSKQEKILSLLNLNQVLVISGATGCGKSTQVPQFILEEAIARGRGGECSIVCTQPRRISAVGLAQRVSQERAEDVGGVVGYSVRFDNKVSQSTRLTFCTTGILLRRLISDSELRGVSHVIVDEVHERSLDSDLLLLLLKAMQKRPNAPKVVLMSATADADLFASYFNVKNKVTVGKLSIPGFTHPVTDFYLDDILEMTQFEVGPRSRWARRDAAKSRPGGKTPASRAPLGSLSVAESWEDQDVENGPVYSQQTLKSLSCVDESLINNELIEELLCKLLNANDQRFRLLCPGSRPKSGSKSEANAVLIFLPGAPEIDRLVRQLRKSRRLQQACEGRSLRILPLHGSLSPSQQAQVFEVAGPGTQKIVLATNVAETSITIPDVICVLDCGRVKEISYDPARGLSRLEEGWVSKAAAAQRRGRAGRVQPGACFKLFSRHQAESLQEHQIPEVRRTALHQLCLSVKAILPEGHRLETVLASLLTPPEEAAISSAVGDLTRMEALDAGENLTALGRHLASMPMHPRLGKALIYAAMLRCLDPMLTIVSALAYGRSMFQAPPDLRDEANAAKRQLCEAGAAAKSDHLTMVVAFNKWHHELLSNGPQAAKRVCSTYFLSEAAMDGILLGRRDFASALVDLGFVPHAYVNELQRATPLEYGGPGLDEFSGNARIIKAATCAGFYPSLLRVEHPAEKYAEMHSGAFAVDSPPQKLRFMDRTKGRVFIHPGSVLFNVGRFDCPWLIYTDLSETSKVYCREASMVPVYSLLLFGGNLVVEHENSLLKLDGWATFKCAPQTAVLVKALRGEIERLLWSKVENPAFNLAGSKTISALHQLLATDGF